MGPGSCRYASNSSNVSKPFNQLSTMTGTKVPAIWALAVDAHYMGCNSIAVPLLRFSIPVSLARIATPSLCVVCGCSDRCIQCDAIVLDRYLVAWNIT